MSCCCPCKCKQEEPAKPEPLDAYKLLKPMPGLRAGIVFVHDEKDSELGSISYGCFKLAWDKGSCQFDAGGNGWCGDTFVLPGQMVSMSGGWFEKVDNEDGRYYCGRTKTK